MRRDAPGIAAVRERMHEWSLQRAHMMFYGSIRWKKLGASFTEIGQDPIEILALAVAALNARK